MRRTFTVAFVLLAILAVGSLFAGGSKEQPSSNQATQKAANPNASFLAGLVTDTGGIDDRSFNA
ncbi:MAG TPA: BMP family ABC transporter substrate-binding protein, partial [Spirochaetia bacterium]|nr:BMP family ABC transporter substrate-binding protein [Spirochaetia bacterium]